MEWDSRLARSLVHPNWDSEVRRKLRRVTVTFQLPIFILLAQEDLK